MIRVGGRSYKNGIRFTTNKYSVRFKSYSDSTQMFLSKNEGQKTTKVLDFLKKIPLVRGLVSLIRDNKILCIVLFSELIINILSDSNSEFLNTTISLPNLNILLFFIALILICYMSKKIYGNAKTIWQYHGAEHKVIFTNYEEVELTLENCRKAPRVNDNCGTMFVSIILVVLLIINTILNIFGISIWTAFKFLIVYIISYELFLLNRDTPILRWIFKIGYWIQEHLVTKEPTDEQLNQAIEAFKLLERAETGQIPDEELQELLKKVVS